MRILQIVHSFLPYSLGGTELYTYNLSKELAKNYKVYIFHRINNLRKKDYLISHYDFDGLEVYALNNTFRNYDSFEMTYKNKTISDRFSLILDKIKPDIVHIQHLLYLSISIIEEIKKRNIPIIFTLHDYWLICPQGQLLRNSAYICSGNDYSRCLDCIPYQLCIRRNLFNYYYFLKKILPESLFQIIKNRYLNYAKKNFLSEQNVIKIIKERASYILNLCSKVDLFISPSEFLKNKFVIFGISEDKIILSRYGFNLDYFKDLKKTPSRKLRFAFIGNIMPAKGLHILIEAFNRIKYPDAELRIYGKTFSYKSQLENYFKYIKKILRNKNIKFMGGFDNRNIADIFKEIDVLIVPSIWPENSPLVIQEAFAAKTPVIASEIGGISELIQDNKNGLLFEVSNLDSLYEKIRLFIENHKILEKLSENIKPPKDIKENAKEMEEIYKKLLNRDVI